MAGRGGKTTTATFSKATAYITQCYGGRLDWCVTCKFNIFSDLKNMHRLVAMFREWLRRCFTRKQQLRSLPARENKMGWVLLAGCYPTDATCTHTCLVGKTTNSGNINMPRVLIFSWQGNFFSYLLLKLEVNTCFGAYLKYEGRVCGLASIDFWVPG